MDNVAVKTYVIDPQNAKLYITLTDDRRVEIDINDDSVENNEPIYKAHISLRGYQYNHRNVNQSVLDGCLPSSFLIHVPKPSVNINTRYLINLFIEHASLLFSNNDLTLLFDRDDKIISIPISDENMNKLYDKMIGGLLTAQNENENNENDKNIQILMKMVLQYLLKVQTEGEKNTSGKNIKKIKKCNNIVGGLNHSDLFDQLNNTNNNNNLMNKREITKNLQDSTASIKQFIRENREIIKSKLLENNNNDSAFRKIVEIMEKDHTTPLYIQYAISFDSMLEFIGQVFNVALYSLIPQTSFILALQACFYNAAYLYQLDILDKYTDIIFLPVLHRLSYSCFPTLKNNDSDNYIDYVRINYNEMFDKITNLNNDKNIETLTKIALKVNMRDEKLLEGLFWLLNDARGFTFEYYLILLAHLFSNTNKCKSLNKLNKIFNIGQFLKPLYDIISQYKEYVTSLPENSILSSHTLDNFNKLYNRQISEAISHFSTHLLTF